MELQPNTLFHGRYRLIQQKGRGAFGEVWLARDEQLDLEVAIKIYIALDDRGVEDFKTEFRTSYDLTHPNLLHAYHFDLEGRRPYLVMPYCPGKAADLVGSCREREVWLFIRDVAAGLAYLHERDIIHHDIKPDNVLKSAGGAFVITDFGISQKMRSTLRRNSTRQMDQSIGGALPYMGPETFTANPEAVKATDIWALGAALYEIVTGELPFFGQGGGMQLHGAEIPAIKASVSEGLMQTIRTCLSAQTWDRPTARQLVETAEAVLSGKQVPDHAGKDAAAGGSGGGNVGGSGGCNDQSGGKSTVAFDGQSDSGGRAGDKDDTSVESKPEYGKRNWFVCGWIWLMILTNLLLYGYYFSFIRENPLPPAAIRTAAIFALLAALGGWMLWRCVKWGFWLFLASSSIPILITYAPDDETLIALLIGWLIGSMLLFGILHIRRNGVAAWALMDYKLMKPGMAPALAVAAVLVVAAVAMPNQYAAGARNSYDTYLSKLQACREKVEAGGNSNPQALIDARKMLDEIRLNYEVQYGSFDARYNASGALAASIRQKSASAAGSWAGAGDAQRRIGNTQKALEFYATSLQLDDAADVRKNFETLARKTAFLKPLDLEFKGEGAWGEALRADRIKYLHTRLKYDAWDKSKKHETLLKIKIYEDGILSDPDHDGYTYTHTVTVGPKGGYLDLSSWGNDAGGHFRTGSLRVEVWVGSNKLITESAWIY